MDIVTTYSSEYISIGGEFMTVFLIIILSISLLVMNTKYWNKYVSNTMDQSSYPFLIIFMMILIFKMILII